MAKEIDILFKQTVSKNIRCKLCGCRLDGECGYVKISIKKRLRAWIEDAHRTALCHECFNAKLSYLRESQKGREESYKKLIKKKILEKL